MAPWPDPASAPDSGSLPVGLPMLALRAALQSRHSPASRLPLAVAFAATLLSASASAVAAQTPVPAPAAAPDRPTLVVMIMIDQLRGDYLDRFRPTLTGGLARLVREGAVFMNGFHDHANTETAPGHASPLSGRHPRSHGVVLNSAGVPDAQYPLIGGGGPGASPYRFRGTSLFDWMRLSDPNSRALAVSRKDRGAILPLGRSKQPAFWYAAPGRFTTSSYYADTLPDFVNAFNARGSLAALAGKSWEPLLEPRFYAERDTVPEERPGQPVEQYTFPYTLATDLETASPELLYFPWMDSLTIDLALDGVVAMELGAGDHTDLLALSLSTTDAIGHRYGPDSKELHDQMIRVDRQLGRFLDSLYTLRDPRRVIIALTSDHGVSPLPGAPSRDPNENALRVDVYTPFRALRDEVGERGIGFGGFRLNDGELRLDRQEFAANGIDADSVIDVFVARTRAIPGVLRVDRMRDLAAADTVADPIARRWLHMFPDDIMPEAVITLTPYSAWGNATYAQHGSPHDYDANVPIIFHGAPFVARRIDDVVRVIDIAPTLARALEVRPLERLDGVVLEKALRSTRVGAGRRAENEQP